MNSLRPNEKVKIPFNNIYHTSSPMDTPLFNKEKEDNDAMHFDNDSDQEATHMYKS